MEKCDKIIASCHKLLREVELGDLVEQELDVQLGEGYQANVVQTVRYTTIK